jgi:hypothetical protein
MRRIGMAIALALLPAIAHAQPLVQDEPAGEPTELAEEDRPELGITLRPAHVRTGDLIHVRIYADARPGDDVVLADQDLAPFEIHARRELPIQERPGGVLRFRFELDLLALEPGEHRLPPIALRVVTADGETGVVRTHGRRVRVGAHLGNEPNARPRPPTAPVSVYEKDYTLIWVLGSMAALLLAGLIGFFAARWWKRRPKVAPPPPPPRPPWEIAIVALTAIQRDKAKLLAENKQVELVDRVSDVTREYLGRRYDFNGLESTTDEVVTALKKLKFRGVSHEEVTALLSESDLVKFAKLVPDEEACDRMLEGAFKIVRATTPRPGATPVARPASSTSGAKIVTREGVVTIPISVPTIEEAEREIRNGASAAFREHARDPSFEGSMVISLSSSLAASPPVTETLARVRADLASELRTIQIASGRRPRLIIEHAHMRLSDAARQGRAARFTVIDDDGVRFEDRRAPEPKRKSKAPADPREQPARPSAQTMPATDVGAGSPPPAQREGVGERGTPQPRQPQQPAPRASWSDPASPFAPTEEATPRPLPPTPSHVPREGEIARAPAADETKASPKSVRPPAPAAAPQKRDVSRVVPELFAGDTEKDPPLLRWITGIPRPIRYLADDTPVETSALGALGLTRGGIHERALTSLRRTIPPGFAPTNEPAILDDAGAALLVLPELVPLADAWIVYPLAGEGLIVMRETAPTTRDELLKLEKAHKETKAPLFDRPVRVSRRGFEPFEWPSAERSTNPGFSSPDRPVQKPKGDGESSGNVTITGDAVPADAVNDKRGGDS